MKYIFNRTFYIIKNYGLFEFFKTLFRFLLTKNHKINLDELQINSNSLDEIFLIFGTDKGKYDGKKTFYKINKYSKSDKKFRNYKEWILRENIYNFDYEMGTNYVSVYEKYFQPIRDSKLNILEIGVAGGHSHASWYNYFKNSKIYGIDIRPEKEILYKGSRLEYNQIDCTNQKQVDKFINKQIKFDIIIDDSLHEYKAFIKNLINFFPSLNSGGYYFLEDFFYKDKVLIEKRSFNKKFGKKLTEYDITMDEIFKCLIEKKYFENIYFDKDSQEYFHQNSSNIELFYPGHPSASIALIRKK